MVKVLHFDVEAIELPLVVKPWAMLYEQFEVDPLVDDDFFEDLDDVESIEPPPFEEFDDEPDDFEEEDYDERDDYDYDAGFPAGEPNFKLPPATVIEEVDEMTPERAAELLLKQAPSDVQTKAGFRFAPERCRYGFLDGRGTFYMSHTACVSALSHPPCNPYGIINWCWDVPMSIVEYVFGPESPWKEITKGMTTYIGADGIHAAIITDLSHSSQLIASFMKAFRGFTESPAHGEVAKALVDAGVHPGIALFYSQYFYANGMKNPLGVHDKQYGWHGSFLNCRGGKGTLENFLAGKHSAQGSYAKSTGYGGCDAIFEVPEPILSKYLKEKYPELCKQKAVESRFAGRVLTGGLTMENLIEIAKLEEVEFIDVDR